MTICSDVLDGDRLACGIVFNEMSFISNDDAFEHKNERGRAMVRKCAGTGPDDNWEYTYLKLISALENISVSRTNVL